MTTDKAKRAEQRFAKVQAGMQDLELWLRDLVRQGLVIAQGQPYSFWDDTAARLVDAQAPGIAGMIREMGSVSFSGVGWEDRLLGRLGRVYLLIEGFKRLDTLPSDVQTDIRTQIGWTQSQEELLAKEGIKDNWLILGQRVEESDNLKTQRIWLWGERTKKSALILNFVYGSQSLDNSFVTGNSIDAELVFFESAYPLRALVKSRNDIKVQVSTIYSYGNIREMMPNYAEALSINPWLGEFPAVIDSLIPFINNYQNNAYWCVSDSKEHQLSLKPNFQKGWQLLAFSGGYPLKIFGEWDGEYFLPLSAVDGDNLVSL
ncbi:MAG: hypothetical protein KME64_25665 [Scytonematopsis contorta HA4267-MV1]|jgi:hypothetical protein|nr:hypothetical protein [Scytonematopsis contorta HA4267-MV1]